MCGDLSFFSFLNKDMEKKTHNILYLMLNLKLKKIPNFFIIVKKWEYCWGLW